MKNNDLQSAAARTHDDLLAIAQMFADAEHYKAAIQVQGFAKLIITEAEVIASAPVSKSNSKVRFAI